MLNTGAVDYFSMIAVILIYLLFIFFIPSLIVILSIRLMNFTKNKTNKKVFGVCSGMADAVGMSVNQVRFIWALLGLFTLIAIPYYVLFALFMPNLKEI